MTKYNPNFGDPDMKIFNDCSSTIAEVNFVLEHLCSKGYVHVIETNRLHPDMEPEIRIHEMKSDDKWYTIKTNHHGFDVPGDHWKPRDRQNPAFDQFCYKYANFICALNDILHPE